MPSVDLTLAASVRDRNRGLSEIIKPVKDPAYTCDFDVDRALRALESISLDYGAPLDLNPDFQRGHVWTEEQQSAYVLAMLRRSLPESALIIQFNCANWENMDRKPTPDLPNGLQCLDGLQRLTAVATFLAGDLAVAGLRAGDLEGSSFELSKVRFRFHLNLFSYETREEVLAHYLDFNAGGTPHSPEEIQRVRKLLEQSLPAGKRPSSPGF